MIQPLDLTIANKALMNYMDNKTEAIPSEVIKELMTIKDRSGTFLETLDLSMAEFAKRALSKGKKIPESKITEACLAIARADLLRRAKAEDSIWVSISASALRSLWLLSKK